MDSTRTRIGILIAALAITFAGVQAAANYRANQRRTPAWDRVSYDLAKWRGRDTSFDAVYGSDPADTSLLRIYQTDAEPPVIAYVGFYGDLATILEVHTPELCYPAQGWTIQGTAKRAGGNFRGTAIQENEIFVDKGGEQRLVSWWYNAGSRPFVSRIRYVYALILLSTFTGRTDGSMVRLETPIANNDVAGARARIQRFREIFLPALDTALPR